VAEVGVTVKNIAVVKLPLEVLVKPSTHRRSTSYSPVINGILCWSAAAFMVRLNGALNGPSKEIPTSVVDTSGMLKPLGPVTMTLKLSAVVGHPAEVVTLMTEVSKPVSGSRVKVPREPGGGSALATPLISSPPPAAMVTVRPAATSRRGNFLARMIELTLYFQEGEGKGN
jgi:hypothetical protein